jgi:two-component system sensor histidine kinase AtoS
MIGRLRLRTLRGRLLCAAVLGIVPLMAGAFVIVERHQRTAIVDELQRRGEVLARSLAAVSQGPLLLYNFNALEQNVARVATEADVVYAIVLDGDGKVAAHSRHPDRVGQELPATTDREAARSTVPLIREVVASRQAVLDFSVPVLVNGQKWGTVRVGLSQRRMAAEIARTRWELAGLTLAMLFVGAATAAVIARRVSRPVQRLVEGAAAIARGDLDQRIEPATDDEIGRLAATFNHMAAELSQRRAALEAANADLRRGLEELVDLKSYTDNILASLATGIVTVDLEGRVVTLNPAAEAMTGFFAGEARGRYCTEVFAHTPDVGELLMETLASHVAVPGVTLTLRRRNGRTVPVEMSTAPLRGGEGKELGALGAFRDLTRMRQLEDRLSRSDRLAALGEMAAGLAHEIKNPLTALLTFSRHLTRRFDDPDFREKFQAVVPRELERINLIVERLLELSRPPRLAFKPLRLPALLDRVLELYAERLDAQDVRVSREWGRDLPSVWADHEALYRAFVNLVANSLDAMPRGGRLIVRAMWTDGDAIASARGAGRRVAVEIEDTGTGIPGQDIDRVFNPFFSTKEGGTGLGLALTHKIVEEHGGSIDVRSTRGVGATFRVVLPLVPDAAAETNDDRVR